MQIESMDTVIVTDLDCCLYIVNGDVLVNSPDEGSEDQDHMFGRISELADINPITHVLTSTEVTAKWPLISKDDLV